MKTDVPCVGPAVKNTLKRRIIHFPPTAIAVHTAVGCSLQFALRSLSTECHTKKQLDDFKYSRRNVVCMCSFGMHWMNAREIAHVPAKSLVSAAATFTACSYSLTASRRPFSSDKFSRANVRRSRVPSSWLTRHSPSSILIF